MKHGVNLIAAVFSLSLFAQAVDADLPTEGKKERLPYYHDSTPLNAFHSIYSDIYIHKWLDAPRDGMEPIPQAEQDKISDNFLKHCRENQLYAELLDGLIYREKWDEVIATVPEALKFYASKASSVKKLSGWDLSNYGKSYMAWAHALMGKGLKDEAKAKLEEIRDANIGWAGYYNGGRAMYPHAPGHIRHYLHWFDPDRLDALGMPRWSEGVAFPEPQVAVYEDKWVKCPSITIVLRGIGEDDPRIKLLTLKLRKRGFKYAFARKPGRYTLAIALDEKCNVDRPEGYTLHALDDKCVIKGRDKQGVLWGIVSFLQILNPEKKEMRISSIEDWPALAKRGFLGRRWCGTAEFSIFNKMNYVTIKPHALHELNFTPLNLFEATEQGTEFKDFGLDLFYDNRDVTMDCAWPLCWNVNLARLIEHAKTFAKCNVNYYFGYDDARYWKGATYTEEDQATGLKPSDYDAPFIAKLYKAVKAEYPDFKMQFCPPFYWGPNADHPYPDDRNKYLKSIAEHLPEEIDIYWSGERVGSHTKPRHAAKWFAGLIGRKPSLYQNKTGAHYYQNYIVDRTRWQDWYYDGFINEMRSIQKNSATPTECPQITTLADYCWNPKKYDENRSIKRGLDNYVGQGYFELLDSVYPLIMKYDGCHKFGRVNGKSWYVELDEIVKDYTKITNVTEEAKVKYGEKFVKNTGAWMTAVSGVGSVLKVVRSHQGVDRRKGEELYITNAVNDAVKYCDYNPKQGDILLDGFSFRPITIAYVPSSRRGTPISTSRLIANYFAGDKGTAKFTYNKAIRKNGKVRISFAAYNSYDRFKIVLNGNVVHEGRCPRDAAPPEKGDPRHFEFEVPATYLVRGTNVLEFENTARAWLELVYVVIQPRS